MRMWITKDSTGLLQLWKNKPKPIKTEYNGNKHIIFGDVKTIGIEVNSLFNDIFSDRGVICREIDINL